MGATHITEHFVQLLGVHDKVGVAYHVVDRIRLGRRDTEDSERPAVLCGCRAQGLGQGETAQLLPSPSFHVPSSCLTSTYPWGLCLNVMSRGKPSLVTSPCWAASHPWSHLPCALSTVCFHTVVNPIMCSRLSLHRAGLSTS